MCCSVILMCTRVALYVLFYKAHTLYIGLFLFGFTVNKQINDKERIAAAMENPNLKELVEKCIKEEDY